MDRRRRSLRTDAALRRDRLGQLLELTMLAAFIAVAAIAIVGAAWLPARLTGTAH
jgi:hypothetical protein